MPEFDDVGYGDAGALDGDELIAILDDPSGTPETKTTTPSKLWAYTPANSGDWTGADPTDIFEALDRIAAEIGPVG